MSGEHDALVRELRGTIQRHAIDLAQRAKRLGWLQPCPCRICGERDPHLLEMHHPNYNKPLAVVWLCRRCHRRQDARPKQPTLFRGKRVLSPVKNPDKAQSKVINGLTRNVSQ